jgi:peptide/nickel transport system permease protein
LVLLTIMAVWLKLLPMGFSKPIGVATADVSLLDWLRHLALPALTLSLLGIPNIALHTREKTIDVMDSEYVRLARVRGESTASIVWRHGLRNLALPALTLHLASISEVFGGSVLIEQVFTYPGLGQAAVAAGLGGDASLLVAISLLSAAIVFAGNLAANLSYRLIDPRLRLGALEANRRPPAWLTPPSPPSPEASDA